MSELGTAYAGCRRRIAELVEPLGSRATQTMVPACPAWSVHDLLAHVVGSADDVLAGRLDGSPGEAWTAAQVEARRGRSTNEVLAEWERLAPGIEKMIDEGVHRGPLHFALADAAISDALSHEHDIRAALGAPGARDSDAMPVGLAFYARNRIEMAAQQGASLRVRVIDGPEFGDPGATVTLTGEAFELLRALAGRRSAEQLRALSWTGDAESVIPAFERIGALRPPVQPLEE